MLFLISERSSSFQRVSSWLTDVMVRIVGNAQLPNAPSLVALTTANGQSCLHKAAMGDTPGHVECVRLLAGPEANQVRRQPARTLSLSSQRLSVWLWCGFAGDADEAGPRLAERRAPRRRTRLPAGEILQLWPTGFRPLAYHSSRQDPGTVSDPGPVSDPSLV